MLLGQEERKITQKHQVAFPKKFRVELGSKLIVTKGIDKCLQILSPQKWEVLLEGTKDKPFLDKATRELHRYLFGNAVEITLDAQGRMLIPASLVEHAGFSETVIFIGVQRYVELWDKDTLKKHEQAVNKSIELFTIDLSKTRGHE